MTVGKCWKLRANLRDRKSPYVSTPVLDRSRAGSYCPVQVNNARCQLVKRILCILPLLTGSAPLRADELDSFTQDALDREVDKAAVAS
jgi:hypothetical protein